MKFYKAFKKSGLIYVLLLPVLFSCAQSKPTVKNVNAFYTVWMPGNIMVGADGEPLPGSGPRINYILYAETSSSTITWDTASIAGAKYKILPTLIKENTIDAGLDKNSQQPIVIKVQNGGYLWRLQLQSNENNTAPVFDDKPQPVMLWGFESGKKFEYLVEKVVELYTLPAY